MKIYKKILRLIEKSPLVPVLIWAVMYFGIAKILSIVVAIIFRWWKPIVLMGNGISVIAFFWGGITGFIMWLEGDQFNEKK